MDLLEKFIEHIKTQPQVKSSTFLLAVSGGVDSVVLCDLFHKAGLQFIIAHCNFQLRGEESERDEQFVGDLAKRYAVELFINRFATASYAEENKLSIQVAARNLRYDWFRALAAEKNIRSIVTAHHADDNIETVVMNFFRGTGLKGLVGMDQHFSLIYRPLLHCRKKELLTYASHNNLRYVEDSSNISSNYTRNYFRNELLPAIEKVFPSAQENILKNIDRLYEVEQVYNEAIETYKSKLVTSNGKEEHIPILKLRKNRFHRTLIWEIIKEKNFSAAQVDEVIKLFDADNGSYMESLSHKIIRNRKWLVIVPIETEGNTQLTTINEKDRKVIYDNGSLHIEHNIAAEHVTVSADNNVAILNEAELKFPLLLRKTRQGDYFYPLGMQKKKKLSRFFIDQKLSLTEKQNVWVLESDKRIVWVVGLRIDDRFKMLPFSSSVVRIKFVPS